MVLDTYKPFRRDGHVWCYRESFRKYFIGISPILLRLNALFQGFINQFCGPIALKNIRYNYVFVCISRYLNEVL